MMPVVEKAADQPWPSSRADLEVVLLPGTHGPGEFSGVPRLTLRASDQGPVRIQGGEPFDGAGNPPSSLRFNDGCHELRILGPLEVFGSPGRGIRITVAQSIILSDLFLHHMGGEGIITGNCPGGIYDTIRVEDSVRSVHFSPDKRHGIYISGDGSNSTVRVLTVRRVTGSAFQGNGHGMGEIIRELQLEQLAAYHCGSGGTPPISLMACVECLFSQFYEDWTTSDKWSVLFSDGGGRDYACYRNVFREFTVPAGTRMAQEDGSSGNQEFPGDGWEPGEEPGEPEEPPTYDPGRDLDLVEAALAEVSRQRVIVSQGARAIEFAARTAQEAQQRLEEGLAGE